MKTSTEMQLRILDKMRENVDNDETLYKGIQFYSRDNERWLDLHNLTRLAFADSEWRIKPQTITINGVEIPKPLQAHEIIAEELYYFVDNSVFLHKKSSGNYIADHGIRFVYETKEEAIEASKLLFGIGGLSCG